MELMKNYIVQISGCNIVGLFKILTSCYWKCPVAYKRHIWQCSDKFNELMNVTCVTDVFESYLIVFILGRSARHVPGWNSRSGFQVGKELLLLPLQKRLISEDNVNSLLTLILICYFTCHASFHSTPSLDGWRCVFNTKQLLDQRERQV